MFRKQTYMSNIKELENQQLGFYYEILHKKINDIKLEIFDDIADVLGNPPPIEYETYEDPEKFHTYCTTYLSYIQKETKDLFQSLLQQVQDTQEEICTRQLQMMKEIGITTPSIRTEMIAEQMRGKNFPIFDRIIRYIKLKKERPKNKKIDILEGLEEMFEKL